MPELACETPSLDAGELRLVLDRALPRTPELFVMSAALWSGAHGAGGTSHLGAPTADTQMLSR